tara:strand:+ start:984 stop:1169 length:186 start_codon:yes stop_codon:yes gene_type:complete
MDSTTNARTLARYLVEHVRGIAEDTKGRVFFQHTVPKPNVFHAVEITENVQANNNPLRVLF